MESPDTKTLTVKRPAWSAPDFVFREDSEYELAAGTHRITLRSRSNATQFVGFFGPPLLLFLCLGCWFAVRNFNHRIAVLSVTCIAAVSVLTVALSRKNGKRPECLLSFDRDAGTIAIPASERRFEIEQCLALLHESVPNHDFDSYQPDMSPRWFGDSSPEVRHALEDVTPHGEFDSLGRLALLADTPSGRKRNAITENFWLSDARQLAIALGLPLQESKLEDALGRHDA